jgi:hypothetical protein
MQHKVVYLSHGGQKYYDQTRFSVLSLLHYLIEQKRNDVSIVIYTDDPEQSPAHNLVRSIELSREELRALRGPLEFVHRVKLETMRRAQADIGLPFIYVDCDTQWFKVPDEQFRILANGGHEHEGDIPVFYMHKFEGELNAGFYPQYLRLLQSKRSNLIKWKIKADPPWEMWNSGTVGISPGMETFFDEALCVTDDLLLDIRHRMFLEQLAISITATSRFRVKPFDDCLAHYWNHGSELPILLGEFFDALPPDLSLEDLARECAQFRVEKSKLEQLQKKRANRFRRWRAKVRNSIHKRKVDFKAFWLRQQRNQA